MSRPSPATPRAHSSARIFLCAALSYLMIAVQVRASGARRPASSGVAQGVDAREPSAASLLSPFTPAPPVSATLTDNATPNTTKVDKGATINYTATITVGASTVNGVEF